jgi:RNA polymerase sigma-70 factor (ECF subfamily)
VTRAETGGVSGTVTSFGFAQAAEQHLDDVYGYLAWFTGDRFAAEDLAAETFERAMRLWHRYDPARGSARTWLCQVARTVALDHFRAERRRTRREQLSAMPERFDERLADGLSPELEDALRGLSAGEREVIALRIVLELDAAATARMLGISQTNCTTRLSRALKKLEEALDVAA